MRIAVDTSEFNPGSFSALLPGFLVIPKAVNFDLAKFKSREKKSLSVGFAPGQPPSI